MISFSDLPMVNAILNGTSFLLLLAGYGFIRRREVGLHRVCMLSALGVSALFLACYLLYHYSVGSKPYPGVGLTRRVYFTVLVSHTILAMAVVPLVLITVGRAIRRQFDRHRQIAHWTLPVWGYVSLTGVVIYLMLYVFTPPAD